MNFEENIKRGTFYSFIPKQLEIKDVPELSHLPFNVMFASFGFKDGDRVMGSALYEPDFSSFSKHGSVLSMTYRNAYGGDSYLTISYDMKSTEHHGEKFVSSKSVGMAFGKNNWKMFFVHFTALGLTNGERCLFSPIK